MDKRPTPIDEDMKQALHTGLLADPVQLELIRDRMPNRDAATAVEVERRQGRGRPQGSRNKRNSKFRDQILSLGPHPGIALQRAYSTPVETLAAQLGCTLLEAAQLGIRAAAELLPYIEGKMPVTIDLREKHDVVLIMAGAPGVAGADLEGIADDVRERGTLGDVIDWGGVTIEGNRIVDDAQE